MIITQCIPKPAGYTQEIHYNTVKRIEEGKSFGYPLYTSTNQEAYQLMVIKIIKNLMYFQIDTAHNQYGYVVSTYVGGNRSTRLRSCIVFKPTYINGWMQLDYDIDHYSPFPKVRIVL